MLTRKHTRVKACMNKIYRPHTLLQTTRNMRLEPQGEKCLSCVHLYSSLRSIISIHGTAAPPPPSLSLSFSAVESNKLGAINKCHVTAIGLGQCCWLQKTQCDDPSTIDPQKDRRTERKTKTVKTERLGTESESDGWKREGYQQKVMSLSDRRG